MVKRPGLGKRKRVTLPQMESSDQPEQPEQAEQPDELPETQASDPGDPATQATQPEDTEESEEPTHGRYKKKRVVRMTDARRMRWPSGSRTILKCTTKARRSTGTWTARRLLSPPRPGPWAWKVSSLML